VCMAVAYGVTVSGEACVLAPSLWAVERYACLYIYRRIYAKTWQTLTYGRTDGLRCFVRQLHGE